MLHVKCTLIKKKGRGIKIFLWATSSSLLLCVISPRPLVLYFLNIFQGRTRPLGIKEMLENTDLKFRRGLCWKKGFRAVSRNWSEDCWWNFSPQVSYLELLQSCLARESVHPFTKYTACPEDWGIPSSRKLLDILNLLFACS